MKIPLIIDPNDNPEVKKLVTRSNELVEHWGELNERVLKSRTPWFPFFGFKKRLIEIGRAIHAHEKEWVVWDRDARAYSLNPHLIVPAGGPSEITFLHWTAEFRERIRSLSDQMRLIENNYNQVWGDYREQRNLLISLGALILSVGSSVLSIILL